MREILFRGKRIDNGEWAYGNFVMDATEQVQRENIPLEPILADGFIRRYDLAQQKIVMHEVDRETIGQYTGLTDKNGKKIFEGDIVRCYDRNSDDEFTAVVEFGNPNGAYNWGFQLRPITKTNFNTDILLWVEMEETGAFIDVIGNIHDNPKLVKGE